MTPGDLGKIISCALQQSRLIVDQEIQFQKSAKAVANAPGMDELMRKLSGADDWVEKTCPECSFEYRNGEEQHGRGCSYAIKAQTG